MKKALIIGLSGFNLGDEAIAVASYVELKKKYDEVSVTTVNPGTLEKYGIPEVILSRKSISSWRNIFREIKSASTVYIGGGSLIQDKLGIGLLTGVLSFFLQMVILSKILSKNVRTLPIGADELKTRTGKIYAKIATRILGEINLRDEESSDNVKRLASNKTNIYADPAYLLKTSEHIEKNNRVLVSLVYENIDFKTLKKINDSLISALKSKENDIYYIAMEKREEDELSLYKKLNIPGNKILTPNTIYEAIREIRSSKILIAMRLHALILGHGHTPLLGISRTTKTAAFCKEGHVPYFDLTDLPSELEKVIPVMINRSLSDFEIQKEAASEKTRLANSFFDDN